MKQILHIKTGGTIGGCVPEYKEIAEITSIFHDPSDVKKYLHTFQIHATFEEVEICHKDSRAITEEDRSRIVEVIENAFYTNNVSSFLITHGTFTMPDTGVYLQKHLSKEVQENVTIVITGSMYPLNIIGSDATLNLGAAISTLINTPIPLGILISMHGKNWNPAHVYKNIDKLLFEEK